ncbi:MAG: VOC family protein [Bacteroidota bacterium]
MDPTNNNSPFLGLRTAAYQVSHLKAAKAWYTQAFKVAPYFDEDFYVGFNVGGFELGLQPSEVPAANKKDSVFVYWGVEDIETVYAHLLDLGAEEHEAPHGVGGPLLVASVKDPWGNILGLIFNPTFSLNT